MSVAVQSRVMKHRPKCWIAVPLLIAVAGCPSGAPEHRDAMTTGGQAAAAGMTSGGGATDDAGSSAVGGSGGMSWARSPLTTLPDDLSSYREDLLAAGSGFEPMRCTNGKFDPMPFVVVSDAVDFQALRAPRGETPPVMSEAGTLCESATDATACVAAYDAVPEVDSLACSAPRCSGHIISTTLGDEVKHLTSIEEKRAFLGAIDTPEDAQLLVVLHGYTLGHGDGCATATVREIEDGYEVYARIARHLSPCGLVPDTARVLLTVSRDGVVSERLHVNNDAVLCI